MAELLSTLAEATLIGGFSIVFEAIDPVSGAAVTGVKVSKVNVYCETASGDAADDTGSGLEVVVPVSQPLWAPEPSGIGGDDG